MEQKLNILKTILLLTIIVLHLNAKNDLCTNISKLEFKENEKFVLNIICGGENYIDLNSSFNKGNDYLLSQKFLKQLFLTDIIPVKQLIIKNAIFNILYFSNVEITNSITFENCDFNETINFNNSKFFNNLHFDSCNFKSKVYFDNVIFFNSLDFNNSNFYDRVDFYNIQINDYFNLKSNEFNNIIWFELKVNDSISILNKDVIFSNLELKNQLQIENSNFYDYLSLQNGNIKGYVSIENSIFQKVNMLGSKINRQLLVKSSNFNNDLTMQNLNVKELFFIIDSNLSNISLLNSKVENQSMFLNSNIKNIELGFADIYKTLTINSDSTFSKLNLKSSKVNGILTIQNNENSDLNLENSQIEIFDVNKTKNIQLLGFKFNTLSENIDYEIVLNILENNKYYPSVYQEFANFYKRIGEFDKMENILYESEYRNYQNLFEKLKK